MKRRTSRLCKASHGACEESVVPEAHDYIGLFDYKVKALAAHRFMSDALALLALVLALLLAPGLFTKVRSMLRNQRSQAKT